jgi:hypothetical protein
MKLCNLVLQNMGLEVSQCGVRGTMSLLYQTPKTNTEPNGI